MCKQPLKTWEEADSLSTNSGAQDKRPKAHAHLSDILPNRRKKSAAWVRLASYMAKIEKPLACRSVFLSGFISTKGHLFGSSSLRESASYCLTSDFGHVLQVHT